MAHFRPFRGIRYNLDRVTVEEAVAPPYDKITEPMRLELSERSPWNVVHLTLGGPLGGAWHEEAGRKFHEWIRQGVLVREERPAFYRYEHEFFHRGRKMSRVGFIGILRMEEGENAGVHPHERTFVKPMEDRLKLLRLCQANLEPIFLIIPDADRSVARILEGASPTEVVEAHERPGILHRFAVVSDPVVLDRLTRLMEEKDLLIADGHHRFGVAKKYRDEMWEKSGKKDLEAPYNYRLAYVSAVEDPSLVILPTHRAVSVPSFHDLAGFWQRLGEEFEVAPAGDGVDRAVEALADPGIQEPRIAVYYDGKTEFLSMKGRKLTGLTDGDMETLRASLPAAILQNNILEPLLGITKENIADQIQFFRDPAEMKQKVDSGQADLGFLLRPVDARMVWSLAARGGIMPQKSTDFFPKVLSGLVFYGY